MQNTIFVLLFLATAPIVLMPSAIALFTRRKSTIGILMVNLLVWGGLYFLMHDVLVSSVRGGFTLPLPLMLLTWLVLLRFAVSDDKASAGDEAPSAQ